jgi:diphthine-ammonia ligase
MKFAALVSGGKDSIYSIQECIRNGHELICCIHLGAPITVDEESFMYQTAASNVIPTLVEECLGVPLIFHTRTGKSIDTSMVYENNIEEDEVEDLFIALKTCLQKFPSVEAVSSGAILSTYQRIRIENVCCRLGLTSLSYLWRLSSQHEILQKMIQEGIEAILVKTACPPGLIPEKHLNKTIRELYDSGLFHKLHDKYQFHYCGEGGEYESLVLDCPLFKKRLILIDIEITESVDGVGELIIKKFQAVEKESQRVNIQQYEPIHVAQDPISLSSSNESCSDSIMCLPHIKRVSGGLLHISEIICPYIIESGGQGFEADIAVKEALHIFEILNHTLKVYSSSSIDVVFVHLYLSEISHFTKINHHYREVFGTLLPPSRSTVAVGKSVLPGGRRVMLDCLVQIGSGVYMRGKKQANPYADAALVTKTAALREVLHVQSISHWAPVCVGPYSQCNTLRSGIHFIAGQIGLDPPTMKLKHSWSSQLKQSWTNLAKILDSLGGASLKNIFSCLIYVSGEVEDVSIVPKISREMITCNGFVVPGFTDATTDQDKKFDGYEDEDTWMESTRDAKETVSQVPFLIVVIPEMPVGALVEIEATCMAQKAFSCLESKSSSSVREIDISRKSVETSIDWITGNDFDSYVTGMETKFRFNVTITSFGSRCVSMITIGVSRLNKEIQYVDPELVLFESFNHLVASLDGIEMNLQHVLNIRIYYVSAYSQSAGRDDGLRWRIALASALSRMTRKSDAQIPATTLVPVMGIHLSTNQGEWDASFLAMQVFTIDPVHMETELWIHHGREND